MDGYWASTDHGYAPELDGEGGGGPYHRLDVGRLAADLRSEPRKRKAIGTAVGPGCQLRRSGCGVARSGVAGCPYIAADAVQGGRRPGRTWMSKDRARGIWSATCKVRGGHGRSTRRWAASWRARVWSGPARAGAGLAKPRVARAAGDRPWSTMCRAREARKRHLRVEGVVVRMLAVGRALGGRVLAGVVAVRCARKVFDSRGHDMFPANAARGGGVLVQGVAMGSLRGSWATSWTRWFRVWCWLET